jgi:hypothetical protein
MDELMAECSVVVMTERRESPPHTVTTRFTPRRARVTFRGQASRAHDRGVDTVADGVGANSSTCSMPSSSPPTKHDDRDAA